MPFSRVIAIVALVVVGFGAGIGSMWWFTGQTRSGVSLVYLTEGREAISRRAYVEAIAMLNRAVSLDPRSWLACTSLAKAYEQNGNTGLAIRQYSECLAMSRAEHMVTEQRSLERTIEELKERSTGTANQTPK